MIYLSLNKNSIKLISLSKSILNQYSVSHFQKKHETDLLENNQISNVDLIASAIKEALTQATPKEIKDKDVTLILPLQSFETTSYPIPKDLSENAILPFVKDKTRADFTFDVEEAHHDYFITKNSEETQVSFFALEKQNFDKFQEVFKLLGLNIVSIIPESVCYFKLFEKTLRNDKKENILYVYYDNGNSAGYLYNSLGLLKKEKISFESDIEKSLKSFIEESNINNQKINRIILSGNESDKIRQDLFTKNVGAWTNPLKKIISNFYQDYLKMLILEKELDFSILEFDICFGAFVFCQENKNSFNIKSKGFFSNKKTTPINIPKDHNINSSGFNITKKDVGIFAVSFILSLALFIGISTFNKNEGFNFSKNLSFNFSTPTPTPTPIPPTPTPTPTPAYKKEEIKIKILNGGGVKGKATEVKDIFKDLGYSEILTGNADNFDYEKSEIQIKDEKKFLFDIFKKDLSKYTNLTKASTLEESATADVIFIIGQDFK